MKTTVTRAPAARKAAPSKHATKKRKLTADEEFLASLSPWGKRLHKLAEPLFGKLTKAIDQK